MSFLGADTDELRDAGQVCQDGKETTDQVIAYLKALIAILRAASFFSGGASAAYATYLETVVVPWLQKISMALGLFAQVLNANADAQDQASQGQSVDFGSLPTYTPQVTGDSSVQPFAGTIIGDALQGIAIVNAIADAVDGEGSSDTGTPASGDARGVGSATSIGAAHGLDGGAHQRGDVTPVSGGGSAGGGGTSGGGGSAPLGTSSIGGDGTGSIAGNPDSTGSASTAGGFGGASPGADSLGTVGHTGTGDPVATGDSSSPSYGAAAAIAGGAAAAGVGGAALAARSSGGDATIDRLASQNGRGSSGPEVRDLQQRLTDAGYDTKGVDGQWGGNTERAYDAYRADHPLQINHGSGYNAPSGYDYNQIAGVRGNANVTPEFLRAVEGVAQRTGAQPEHLMAVMSFETGGSFAADTPNRAGSGATGLIQFMPDTARGLDTTTAELARMTPMQQLPYVERYLDQHHGRIGSLEGLYTSVLAGHPTGPGQDLFVQGSREYPQNAGLDLNRDGRITSDEATAAVRRRMGGQ
ncbi:peptidoglycan-binding domain-containing protein [Nocardioides caricicola]|uniref:Peptidoglycan-binding domain-containing protein n=1 Tax=Nocardioides caricicola TaxID=634770 RepID=A0ABW0MZP6_9ACTN